MKVYRIILVAALVLTGTVSAQERAPEEPLKYIDENKDGMNDLFRDADGNGINDINGKSYKHNFRFIDKNGDGINDVFRDANGDGENDLSFKETGAGKSQYKKFLDADSDGVNDIEGSARMSKGIFRDENGDGIDDNVQITETKQAMRQRGKDVFIDSDGDGINDGRDFYRERRKAGYGGGNGGSGNGNGHGSGGKQNRGNQ